MWMFGGEGKRKKHRQDGRKKEKKKTTNPNLKKPLLAVACERVCDDDGGWKRRALRYFTCLRRNVAL